MANGSRGMRDAVVRGLAKVGLVWALAVLGALFVVTSLEGGRADGGYALSPWGHGSLLSYSFGQAPRTIGLALTLIVLAGGLTVLAVGATRRRPDQADESEPSRQ